MKHIKCPYCGDLLKEVWSDSVQGRKLYYECFTCGYCSDEKYDMNYDHRDPDMVMDQEKFDN